MTSSRSEEMLVGIIALAAVPWILWVLSRGLRDARLPIGKGYVQREERPGAYRTLLGFYLLAMLAMSWIGLDLLLGITNYR